MYLKKPYLFIIIILTTWLSIYNKGKHDLQEWDESRNGVNAYEMIQNGDYVNLYYNGKLDTWNAKPPLLIWLIAGSYKLFGFNEFSLRLPITLATVFLLILCFVTIKLLEGELLAFFTCLVLLSCKAILGNHIGLTADFDALLLLFLAASIFTFILYTEKQKKNAILLSGVFLGLAFYTKGTSSFVLIPGMLLYIFIRQKFKLFKDVRLWLAFCIYVLIASSWLLIVSKYGKTTTGSFYGSKNSVETMLIHDTYQRLTNSNFDNLALQENIRTNYLFVIEVLDSRLNLWNYLFYLSIVSGIVILYKNRKRLKNYLQEKQVIMTLLSISLITPLVIVLTFASTKNNWYLAPAFMFVAFITAKGLWHITQKWRPMYFIIGGVFIFTFVRQVVYISTLPTEKHKVFTNNKHIKNKKVVVTFPLTQDINLYLKWLNTSIISKEELLAMNNVEGIIIFSEENQSTTLSKFNVVPITNFLNYKLDEITEAKK